jgi:hypothetical protein
MMRLRSAKQIDPVLAFRNRVVRTHHVGEDAIVGNVMPRGLTHTLVSLAAEPEHIDAELFLHFAADRMDVVADEPHRTSGENRNGLGFEEIIRLLNGLLKLLLSPEDDLLVLHVR